MAGRIAAGRGLAITYKMQVQQPTKTFCNFMQKRLAKNIMIERWFRSFKYEEAYLTQYNNIKEARAAIKRYVHTYNFERYHSALDYHTPAEYYYPAMLMSYVA